MLVFAAAIEISRSIFWNVRIRFQMSLFYADRSFEITNIVSHLGFASDKIFQMIGHASAGR
jgi:hypothetical protein